MPSNARPRKKAKSKPSKNGLGASLDDMANITEMLGRMSLPDDQTIRSMISAAKKGSLVHLSMLCHFMPELSATHAVDAITALCAVLDVPAFPIDLYPLLCPRSERKRSTPSRASLGFREVCSLTGIHRRTVS